MLSRTISRYANAAGAGESGVGQGLTQHRRIRLHERLGDVFAALLVG
jgi:hypothetical protein